MAERKRKPVADKPTLINRIKGAKDKEKPKHTMTFAKFNKDPEAQKRYLDALEHGATFAGASKRAGVSSYFAREYCKAYPEFKKKADEARFRGIDRMSDDIEDALARAAKGGNVVAMLVWLYNRRANKWKDMRSFALKGLDDVLKLLPPEFAGRLRPYLVGAISA